MSEQLVFLMLSIGMLAVGPLLYGWLGKHTRTGATLDSFILFSVGSLVLGVVLPDLIAAAGFLAIVSALAGILGPVLMERLAGDKSSKIHQFALIVGLAGLVLHTALDGIAIASDDHGHAVELALAVSLHRLPVGMTVWALVRPKFGSKRALGVLGLIAGGTIAGFLFADQQLDVVNGTWFACFQAFVAGSLVHVVLHQERASHSVGWKFGEVLGALLGIGLVVGLMQVHDHSGHAHHELIIETGHRLLELSLISAPPLLLGYILAGLAVGFLPKASLEWTARGSKLSQSARGMLFGLPIPICSCGVVPLYQSLVRRGVPVPAAMAFLVATPELEIGAIMLSLPLLGAELTAARLAAAMVVALAVGVLVGGFVSQPTDTERDMRSENTSEGTVKARAKRSLIFGLRDVVDDTAPWIVVGLAIAAAITAVETPAWIMELPMGLDVVFFAALGLPVYVCASGATPLAAALIFAGASPGAAVAFLLSGPASNVTTLGVLSKLHNKSVAAAFGVAVVALAVAAGYAINFMAPTVVMLAADETTPLTHDEWWQWASLLMVILLFAVSLLRQGPREWLGTVLHIGHHHHGHHDHEHGHDHSHHHAHQHDHHHHDHDHHDHDHHDHDHHDHDH